MVRRFDPGPRPGFGFFSGLADQDNRAFWLVFTGGGHPADPMGASGFGVNVVGTGGGTDAGRHEAET